MDARESPFLFPFLSCHLGLMSQMLRGLKSSWLPVPKGSEDGDEIH